MAGCPARATADAGVAEASRASAKVDQITEQTKRFQAATEQCFHQFATRLDRVIDDLGPIKGAHAGNAAGNRFIFAVIPLWLLVGADLATRLTARLDARRQARSSPKAAAGHSFAKSVPAGVIAAAFAAVSVAGNLNALPYQHHVYRGYSRETGIVRFIRNQDSIFAAYRYLARAPDDTAPLIFADQEASEAETIARAVSHVVSADPAHPALAIARLRAGAGVRRHPYSAQTG